MDIRFLRRTTVRCENKDYPYYLIQDRFRSPEGKSVRAVKRGKGKILKLGGKELAVYRDDRGRVKKCRPFARIWVAWCAGTKPTRLGIVRAMARASDQRAKCSAALRKCRSLRPDPDSWTNHRCEALTRHVVQALFPKHFLHVAHFVLHLASDLLGCTSIP
jgi:hypothetical protein